MSKKLKDLFFLMSRKLLKLCIIIDYSFDKIHLNLTFIIFIDNIFRIDKKLFYLLINFPKEIIPIVMLSYIDFKWMLRYI